MATLTDSPAKSADQLRHEMRGIRRELGQDVEEVVEFAEQLMDWRYHVQRFPWATVGIAAMLGYLLVPNRSVALPIDDGTLGRLGERILLTAPTPPVAKKPSMFGNLLSMGTSLAMRAALAYLTQQAGKVVAKQAAQSPPEVQHAD